MAYKMFQNGNVLNQTPVDEDGNAINLYEIIGDGAYLYISQIQYGINDDLNRKNNMFSHGYIVSLKEIGYLYDPNLVLMLSEENFATDEISANQPKDLTFYENRFKLEQCLVDIGLSNEKYEMLILALYAQLESKSRRPLFLQCEYGRAQVKKFMYCIYQAIPLEIRGRISVASCYVKSINRYNLILAKEIPHNELYYNIYTCELNILHKRFSHPF